MPELLIATSNPHKLEEIEAILAPHGWHAIGLKAAGIEIPEPVEDGETFEANAKLKAVYYARHAQRPCLADDSGLEVDALGGAPGVYSARYAGTGNSRQERDTANNERLLRELQEVPEGDRSARFVCAMCLADSDGRVLAETRGTFEGVIGYEPKGTNGFGYDPLLYLPDVKCTSAELSPEAKNARSHRGMAARLMVEQLRAIGLG